MFLLRLMFLYQQQRAQDLFVEPYVDLHLCQLLLESSLYVTLTVSLFVWVNITESGPRKGADILKC